MARNTTFIRDTGTGGLVSLSDGVFRDASGNPIAAAGGISEVRSDSSPQLGGDLDLNGHQVIGQLVTENLVLDGGLL